ncbi:MAG: trypsin-like peptidase domain-containing protein [Firmicutes bacterium]|nr:trypsin-like peptidase domain-containing protein [Bacillota bacterium]
MEDWDKFQGDNNANSSYTVFGSQPKKEPKYVTRRFMVTMIIFSMVLSAAVGAAAYALAMSTFGGTTINKSVTNTNYNLSQATGSELSIQEIVALNENSVVAISTEAIDYDFWMRQYVTEGAGSGVIYSEDGYIITNNHVIQGASNIKVTLNDGNVHQAQLVATDAQTDLAVIKINKTGLDPVSLAKVEDLNVGGLVVAIGNPLGTLSGTATEGIISALEREITIDGKAMSLIQTSASINPGNSGGGLFDQYGNLAGIVVAKSAGSNVEGLGFAIPCDKVAAVTKSLIEKGYVDGRPAAGITIVDLTDAQKAMQAGVSITGIYIQQVNGENAKKAGLQSGDLIYYINNTKIDTSADVLKEIQRHEIGDKVTFTVIRKNEMKKIDVVLEDASKFSDAEDNTKDKTQKETQPAPGNNQGGSLFDIFDFFN